MEEQNGIKHHLIDILDANSDFSAGDFVRLAKEKINQIQAQNQNVIICGGTWFYIKSLLDEKNLPECPINQDLRDELAKFDTQSLWEKLNEMDNIRAKAIHPNNKDKIIRSIEMCQYLNAPISQYEREDNESYQTLWFSPSIEREELYKRINLRVDEMIKKGLEEEWRKNKEKYPSSKIMKNTIGYSEFFDFEDRIYSSLDETIDKIKQHTRNFAKRQLTYFRSNSKIRPVQNEDEILKILDKS